MIANFVGGLLYSVAGPLGVFGGGAICTLAGGALGLVAVPAILTVPASTVPEPLHLSV